MDTSPRVLQIVLSLHPGGTERLVIELAERLHRTMPMAVCCIDDAGSWADGLRQKGIEVTALGRAAGFRPQVARGIAAVARRHRADVIHCHHYSPFVYGCLARMWSPTSRVVFTEHGRLSDAPPSRKRRLANAFLRRIPDGVFTVSHDLKHHIVDEGFVGNRVQVIYNGIDVGPLPDAAARQRVREQLGIAPDSLAVATIARLDPVKDLRTVISAIGALPPTPSVTLVVIGDGSERAQLEALASQVPNGHRVTFLGHRDDARAWLTGCDVYVNSSVSEGVSLTILEAMAAGLPVVATSVGGTPEVVTRECGRLVPARNPQELAAAVRELALDPALRAALGGAGRARVERTFTLDRMVGEYRDVYRSAA